MMKTVFNLFADVGEAVFEVIEDTIEGARKDPFIVIFIVSIPIFVGVMAYLITEAVG